MFDRLARDGRDEFVVLVDVQDGELCEFRTRRDQQVGNRGCAMLTPLREERLYLDGPILDRWREVLNRHRRERRARMSSGGRRVGGASR